MKLMKVQIKEKQTELVEVPQAEVELRGEAGRGGRRLGGARLPSRGVALPARRVRAPRTEGLTFPHGGF